MEPWQPARFTWAHEAMIQTREEFGLPPWHPLVVTDPNLPQEIKDRVMYLFTARYESEYAKYRARIPTIWQRLTRR